MPRARFLALTLALAIAGCSEPEPPRSAPAGASEAPARGAAPEASPSQPEPEAGSAKAEANAAAVVVEATPSAADSAEADAAAGPAEAAADPPPSEAQTAPAEALPSTVAYVDDSPEAEAPEAPEAKPGPTFTVVARLTDRGTPTSPCGVFHFKAIMKFDVLRVVDGRFEDATLYAAVSCPEMPPSGTRKFRFAEGETYELRLRTAGVRRGGIRVDAFEGEPGKRYELLHIEPATAPAG